MTWPGASIHTDFPFGSAASKHNLFPREEQITLEHPFSAKLFPLEMA